MEELEKNILARLEEYNKSWAQHNGGTVEHLESRIVAMTIATNVVKQEFAKYKESEEKYGSCEGCCNIGFRYPYASMYPCNNCVRADRKDYYNFEC